MTSSGSNRVVKKMSAAPATRNDGHRMWIRRCIMASSFSQASTRNQADRKNPIPLIKSMANRLNWPAGLVNKKSSRTSIAVSLLSNGGPSARRQHGGGGEWGMQHAG